MNLDELRGETAVITGAGSGIGRGIAEEAVDLGMNVVLADLSAERLDEVAGALREGGTGVLAVPTDVTDPAQVDRLADAAYAEFGRVTVLANNAGLESVGYSWEVPAEEWGRVIDVNLKGVFHGIRSFVPRMGADPAPSHVVNTASSAAVGTMSRMSAYLASKHAVQSLTESLAIECGERFPQIGVSVMNPGEVATRILEDMPVREQDTAHADFFRGLLRTNGSTPREVARIFFAGITRGDFWILPHPEMFAAGATRRANMLRNLSRPEPPRLPGHLTR